jgi:hypothetical protein
VFFAFHDPAVLYNWIFHSVLTGKIMLGTGEGDIIEHMKGIEDQRDVQ